MFENDFANRLISLRRIKGVSARDMSLTLGQNPGYINNIETGKAMPSMSSFFYICQYFNISPEEFFETDVENPEEINIITEKLKKLKPAYIKSVAIIVDELSNK